MRLASKLYDWLASGSAPQCDQILAAALTHAEPEYFDRIVRHLLERGHEASWAGLIENFEGLSPGVRTQLLARPELVQSGFTRALRASAAEARRNALTVFAMQPCPRLAHLLAEALLDKSSAVQNAAARALRQTAEVYLAEAAPLSARAVIARRAEDAPERRELARALREVVRTFEVHHRVELVEVALWFARDIGEYLWAALTTLRSPLGRVVADHLAAWDNPRLATFLLQALARPEWRRQASQQLLGWSGQTELVALLHNSDMLDDAEVCRGLMFVRHPEWFDGLDANLSHLPRDLRLHVPRWICCLGFDSAGRLSRLARWQRATDPELSRAALYALATLKTPEARARVEAAAGETSAEVSPDATFARWYDTGRSAGLVRGTGQRQREPPSSPHLAAEAAGVGLFDAVFGALWKVCQTGPAAEAEAALKIVRDNATFWYGRLAAALRSRVPRERILAVQVVNTSGLARHFEEELEFLRDDPVEAIARLARTLLRSEVHGRDDERRPAPLVGDFPLAAVPLTSTGTGATVDRAALGEAAGDLRAVLQRLEDGDSNAAAFAELAECLRDCRRALGMESLEPDTHVQGSAEGMR
ncbi:MAG: hypothetical protein KKB50_13080 [Planctomycetes bacterium]|nr:hypothetical protein [Planctomycetota bacterium]